MNIPRPYLTFILLLSLGLVGCGTDAAETASTKGAAGSGLDGGVVDAAADAAGAADVGPSGAADAATDDATLVDVATSDVGAPDAGTADAGTPDAGMSDAGKSDAGMSDAGMSDAGKSDAGMSDAGMSDAGMADAGATDALDGGGIPASQLLTGLQYNGGVAFLRVLAGGQSEFVEISAPLLPSTKTLYSYEDKKFPKTQAAMTAVALKAALIYDDLLNLCAKDYPSITILPPGSTLTLTPAQLQTNFSRTAECSYQKYAAKPYWIPTLVDKVDICGLKLGPDWRMLNEADLLALQPDELKLIKKTIAPPTAAPWSTFYFSLNVYIRRNKGALELSPIANPPVFKTVAQVGASWYSDAQKWVIHLEGDWVLRCRRARKVLAGK